MRLLIILGLSFILNGCASIQNTEVTNNGLNLPLIGLYSASPEPVENIEGKGWRANNDIPWSNIPPPNPNFLDNAGSGPIWH